MARRLSTFLRWTEIADCRDGGGQQAALFGQLAFEPGDGQKRLELGPFHIIIITGEEMQLSENNLLTTIGYGIQWQGLLCP